MQTTAAQATPATSTAAAAAQPTGTLAKYCLQTWLHLHADAARSAATLSKLYDAQYQRRLKRSTPANIAQEHALWDGYYAINRQAQYFAEEMRKQGGLLFIGSTAALAAVRAMGGSAA